MQEESNWQNKPFELRESLLSVLWLGIGNFVNGLLSFFSLKTTKQFWGIVYDSASKQPLDPVIVNLLYSDGREVESCVTDLAGRYGFLASEGKFKIFVRKSNYIFPSKYVEGDSDGIYENLYHGEFFTLSEGSEVVAPNIPMDPSAFDWNQLAKKEVVNRHPYLKSFFKKLIAVVFWFGFLVCGIYIWQTYPHVPNMVYIVGIAYLFLLFLAITVSEVRLWGKIKITRQDISDEGLILEFKSPQFSQVSFGKATTHPGGKFLLRANKGRYILSVSKKDPSGKKIFLAQIPVSVGKNGVFNSTLFLK